MNESGDWTPRTNPSEDYERWLVPVLFRPFAEEMVALAAPWPGEQALDVACGTGIVTRLLAARGAPRGRVVGIDLSPQMLAVARTLGESPQVEWQEASALNMPLPDATFDAVLCQQGLQFFPDRLQGLREMRRVLRPGGRLVVACWRSSSFNPAWQLLEAALSRVVGPEAGKLPPFSLGDKDELRQLVSRAGFSNIVIRAMTKEVRYPSPAELVRRYALSAPTMLGALASASANAREALLAAYTTLVELYVDDLGLSAHAATHILTARA